MNKVYVPKGYKPQLDAYSTQRAIEYIRRTFQAEFSAALHLKRVSAPLFVTEESGLNDNLSGVERPVSFDVPAVGLDAEVVHSLAKWKRLALKRYGFTVGGGLYTDMNAIRRDEELDNIHSIYVDQWDWEKVITKEDRNIEFLKDTVRFIVKAIAYTKRKVSLRYPQLKGHICDTPFFITAQELEDLYPDKSSKEREHLITKEHGTVFIMQIGGKLKSGEPHDGRAPDYDDWSLNGDLLFWDDVLDRSLEVSSMGIRVDADSLASQLAERNAEDRKKYD